MSDKKMLFRNAIEEINGLRYVADKLELRSGLARRVLGESPFMACADEVRQELELVGKAAGFLADEARADALSAIGVKLGRVKDLRGTAVKLAAGRVLDDIEFFEVKVFAMAAEAIRAHMAEADIDLAGVPDVGAVVGLLDPDKTGIPHFSIYDSYSSELEGIRKKIKRLKQKGAEEDKIAELYADNARVEDKVRKRLSEELTAYADLLGRAMTAVARVDILTAKAAQAREMGLCRPEIEENGVQYEGLFNPAMREVLRSKSKEFQPVGISLGEGPTVITGANMGGKTVMLRTVALAQAMAQFGFYVPAERAEIAVVDEILTSVGDGQDEMNGMSSFAAEMVRLNAIVARVRAGSKALVLIDEPARTTNPAEGEAIVNALVDFLAAHRVCSLVTTHYGGIRAEVRRLRVKGFMQGADTSGVTVDNIQDHMDYSLTPDDGEAPREAIRIARILAVDDELLRKADEYYNKG